MSRFLSKTISPRADRIDHKRRKAIDWQSWPDTTGHQRYADEIHKLDVTSHPDVEDDALIAWGLAQSEGPKTSDVQVSILHGEGSDFKWQYDVNDEVLERSFQPQPPSAKGRTLRICFVNTLQANASWLPGNFDIRPCTMRILRDAGLSKALLVNIYTEQGYWAKMGHQRSLRYNEHGSLVSFELCYQYRCGWDTGVSYMHLVRTQHESLYFCINLPADAMSRLKAVIESKPDLAHRDFFLDSLVAHDSLTQWQKEIGSRRDALQIFEKKDELEKIDFKKGTSELHKMARHWLTLGQDVKDFQAQLSFLQESYLLYKKTLGAQVAPWVLDKTADMCESFDMLSSQCDTCARWTSVYSDRTDLRINLLFHLANQREARTSSKIAASSEEIARQAQRDSASMITIAAVTMVFLPGTFISAILSTTYFDYGDDGLHVSKRWWVLLATTIPLTIVVFAVWWGWQRMRMEREGRKVRSHQLRSQSTGCSCNHHVEA